MEDRGQAGENDEAKMAEHEAGTYRALPRVEDDVCAFVLGQEHGPVAELSEHLTDLSKAVARVDEEMAGLAATNPNLAHVVRRTVDALYSCIADEIASEQSRAFLRVVAHFNAFVLLRTLDMQWRRDRREAELSRG